MYRDFWSGMGPALVNPKCLKLTLPNAEKVGPTKTWDGDSQRKTVAFATACSWEGLRQDRMGRKVASGHIIGNHGWLMVSTKLASEFPSTNTNWFTWHYWQLKHQQHLSHQGFRHSQLPEFFWTAPSDGAGSFPDLIEPDSHHGPEDRLWKMLEGAFAPGKWTLRIYILGFCLHHWR